MRSKDTKKAKDTKELASARRKVSVRSGSFVFLSFVSFVSFGFQTFRSGVEGVVIPVSVRNGNKPVAGLTAADFELRDNGVRQELQDVSAEKIPLDLTLLLDLSSSVDGPMLQRLKTAVADTAALLRQDDRIRLVTISQVLHEVFGLRPKAGSMPLDTLAAEGATSLYDGLAVTMMRPTDVGRRQLIVAFTDGRDSTSIIDESAAKAIAQLSDAVVDIVVPIAPARIAESRRLSQRQGGMPDSLAGAGNVTVNGQGPAGIAPDGVPQVLSDLVKPTAGQVIALSPDESISRVFKAVLDDFRATYVLQYVAHGVEPGGWHDVEITLKRRGKFDIRARKGYRGRGTIPPTEERRDARDYPGAVWTGVAAGQAGATPHLQIHDRAR
jgi:VWFA-related protein